MSAVQLAALSYTYAEGMLERRRPYRDAHLARAERFLEQGSLLIVGALGDPPTGALLIFADADSAREFAESDPYGEAGLITDSESQPWSVVMQRPLPTEG